MNLASQMTDAAVLKRLGERLAGLRLARNLTQQELAEQAGLGTRTVQRLESGAAATHLSGFVRVCRVLGLMENLDALLPEPEPSPIAQLEMQGRRRRRATGQKRVPKKIKLWTWGDDQ